MAVTSKTEKPKLPSRQRMNPYAATIDAAMDRLASLEDAVRKNTEEGLRSSAREMTIRRRVFTRSYVPGDGVGWHHTVPQGRDWLLKRISFIANSSGAGGIYVLGTTQDVMGIRELMTVNPTNLNYATNPGVNYGYSDAFDNDIYLRSGQDIYVYLPGYASAVTMVVTLELEEYIPYDARISESEAYAISGTPAPPSPAQAPAINITQDPDEFERHTNPNTYELLESDSLEVTPDVTPQDAIPLIPDASMHLPPHLRGA